MNIQTNEIPKIYVACLASYNNGILHGCWIDATIGIEAIQEAINKMLSESTIPHAEEWAIHDYENFGARGRGSRIMSESESLEEIIEKAEFIFDKGELGAELLCYYGDVEHASEALEDYYAGGWESELEFATNLFDDCYLHTIPENIRFYIDYEAFARDIFIGDYFALNVEGGTHVFHSH